MATANLKAKLAKLKKNFKKAQDVAKQGVLTNDNVTDGVYKAQITGAKGPVEAQQSGRLQAILNYEILDGEFKGEKLVSFPNLENEIGLGILLRAMQVLGYDVEDVDDVEATLADMDKVKPVVKISVKTKGEFQNINIVKLLDEEAPADEEEEEAEPEAEGAEVEPEAEAEAEASNEEIAEGDTITFMLKGEETQAEVIEVVDEETIRIKTGDGTKYKLAKEKATKVVSEEPAAEAEAEAEVEPEAEAEVETEVEAGEETVELGEGSEVVFTLKGKEIKGEILEVVDEDTVRVKAEDKKIYKLGTDKIQPAPKAKAAKKVTRKLPGKKK